MIFSRPDARETCILAAISEGKLSPMPVLHEVSVSYCSINLECLIVTCSKVALSRSLAIISVLYPAQVFDCPLALRTTRMREVCHFDSHQLYAYCPLPPSCCGLQCKLQNV